MFKDIVSQLSLSPSASSQMVLYSRKLKQERIVRGLTALAAVLMLGLQVATIIAPPKASNASSPNDIILGGIVSKDDLINQYSSSAELQQLFDYMGVTKEDLINTTRTAISSTAAGYDYASRLRSSNTDEGFSINGSVYWYRSLSQINPDGERQYEILAGSRSRINNVSDKYDNYFAIIMNSGNIITHRCGDSCPSSFNQTDLSFDRPLLVPITAAHARLASAVLPSNKDTTTAVTTICSLSNIHKSSAALNTTRKTTATSQEARAGDIIQYNLYAKNTCASAINYQISIQINDILDYSTIANPAGATLSGGTLTWPVMEIAGNDTAVRSFMIKVKDPIPNTPISVSDSNSFDLRMSSVYGDDLIVRIDAPLAKQLEQLTKLMPSTNNLLPTIILAILAGIAIFFYFRSRQLHKEIHHLQHPHHKETNK